MKITIKSLDDFPLEIVSEIPEPKPLGKITPVQLNAIAACDQLEACMSREYYWMLYMLARGNWASLTTHPQFREIVRAAATFAVFEINQRGLAPDDIEEELDT